MSSLYEKLLLYILGNLLQIFWPAEITPIKFIGPESKYLFSLGSEMQIGVDDGERAFFHHHPKESGRDHMDSGKSQCLHPLWRSNELAFLIGS